jgi:hypothetical protein
MNSTAHHRVQEIDVEDSGCSKPAAVGAQEFINSMHAAVDHNNQGIEYLEQGLHQKSLQEFKRAAQMLHISTQHLKENHSIVKVLPLSNLSYLEAQKPIPTTNEFIRSTPLLLKNSIGTKTSCTIESAAVLLNMGLCCHLDSAASSSISDSMTNAIALYEMSYTLAMKCIHDRRSHPIILISLNNLGQLAHEVGEFELATRYLEELSSRIIRLGEAGDLNFIDNPQEFLLNALVLRNSYHAAGAA